jgi:hypothetical protein
VRIVLPTFILKVLSSLFPQLVVRMTVVMMPPTSPIQKLILSRYFYLYPTICYFSQRSFSGYFLSVSLINKSFKKGNPKETTVNAQKNIEPIAQSQLKLLSINIPHEVLPCGSIIGRIMKE